MFSSDENDIMKEILKTKMTSDMKGSRVLESDNMTMEIEWRGTRLNQYWRVDSSIDGITYAQKRREHVWGNVRSGHTRSHGDHETHLDSWYSELSTRNTNSWLWSVSWFSFSLIIFFSMTCISGHRARVKCFFFPVGMRNGLCPITICRTFLPWLYSDVFLIFTSVFVFLLIVNFSLK